MSGIISIKGNVKYQITLDPSVWIFDDRRVDLDTYFDKSQTTKQEEAYEKKLGKYWDREIQEGSVAPPTLRTERKYDREKLLTGSFGIPFEPFLNNSEPYDTSELLIIESTNGNITVPLQEGKNLILGFSKNGKPLREDGPVHVYFKDGSNQNNPIRNVTGFTVK